MEKPRTLQVVVRINASERKKLKQAAKNMKVALSTAVRDMALVGADIINDKGKS